jgi:hypothetical protein
MAQTITWVTRTTNIGTIKESEFFSFRFVAVPSSGKVSYAVTFGDLPVGLTLNRNTGELAGTPKYVNDGPDTYSITVQATGTNGTAADRNFTISTNKRPTWITKTVDIGAISENTFYSYSLQAEYNSSPATTYTLISGSPPPGITVDSNGLVSGTPVIPNDSQQYSYLFTVRATASSKIVDYAFEIDVLPFAPIKIIPPGYEVGTVIDGLEFLPVNATDPLDLDLLGEDPNNPYGAVWSIVSGQLPDKLSIDPVTGVISGFVYPAELNLNKYNGNYDMSVYDLALYDSVDENAEGFDPTAILYNFTVQAATPYYRGSETYSVRVISKSLLTADLTTITADNDVFTVDIDDNYNPAIVSSVNPLPQRDGTSFSFQVQVVDFQVDPTILTITSGSLPTGVFLNPVTKVISGIINDPAFGGTPQVEETKDYTFTVVASKERLGNTYYSFPVTFTITVLNAVSKAITWTSSNLLGTMFNGDVSEFSIAATTEANLDLEYSLNVGSELPPGLTLLPNGVISGRVSFNQTPDVGSPNITTYSFEVKAEDTGLTTSAIEEFTIKVNKKYAEPYENIYLRALLNETDRDNFLTVMNDANLFPNEMLYRPEDSYFGKAKDLRFLFLPGLNPTTINDYVSALNTNHYVKHMNFGRVKVANAKNNSFNTKYEVVYIEMTDESITQNTAIKTTYPYYQGPLPSDPTRTTMYPNSLTMMQQKLAEEIGFSYQGALPDWMTTQQEDGTVLGLVNAVVLAYAKPGFGKTIAYRLATAGIEFNDIRFSVDRYNLDNYLTTNYDINGEVFTGPDTFDEAHVTNKYVPFRNKNAFY